MIEVHTERPITWSARCSCCREVFRGANHNPVIHERVRDLKNEMKFAGWDIQAEIRWYGNETPTSDDYCQKCFKLRNEVSRYGKIECCGVINGYFRVIVGEGFSVIASQTFELGKLINAHLGNEFPVIDKMKTDKGLFELTLKR